MIQFELTVAGFMAGITQEWLGFIPTFINPADPTPAAQQIDANYQHGGGWRPMKGWTLDPDTLAISYKGDETYQPWAIAKHGDERIVFYDCAWIAIVQPDGSFEIDRLD